MQSTLLKKILVVALTLTTCIANATNYYASPTGTGTGTISDPCSFSSGKGLINTPGDTLFLRDGIYYLDSKQSISQNGTSSANICIWAYPGEIPILDFSQEPYGSSFPGISFGTGASYMHIKGLVIRYAGDNGIINNGSNFIIENCEFYGNCDTGLQHKNGGGNLILNCDSHDNFDYQTGGLIAPDFGGNADGFADKQFTNMESNIYEGCRTWNNSDDGWDFFQRVGHTYIKNSVCYYNGPANYDMTNHPRATTDSLWFANFTPTELTSYTNYGNGNGFKLGGDYTTHDATLTNCLAVGNTVRGFDQNNNYGTMTVYNCSAYDNKLKNYGFGNSNGGTLIIKNCVSLTGINDLNAQTVTDVNNSWNTSGVTCDASDFISLDTTVILTARQADGSLPNIVFMQLTTGSDLIDAGTNVSLPYSGAAPDMGCFELGNLDQFPGAVTTPTNKDQSITEGAAITDIVFTWSAGATGLSVTGLPSGITPTVNETAKTLTLSGSPTQTGVFNYTVSTVGGSGAAATVDGNIIIKSASAKKIAYVTDLTATNDTKIYPALSENLDFNVTKIDGTLSSIDFSSYDMIVLSELINSTSAGIIEVKAELANKPILMMKVFSYPKTTWNWGGTASDWKTTPSTTAIIVDLANQSNPIFTGLSFTGTSSNELEMVTQTGPNNKGVNSINPTLGTAWSITGGSITTLGTIKGQTANDICVMEIPFGTSVSGSLISNKFIQIGISGEAYEYASDNALKLIANTCYYTMGMSIPTSNKQNVRIDFSIKQTRNEIKVISDASITGLSLYSVSGNKLTESQSETISISQINTGIFILEVSTETGKAFKKIIIQ